MVSIVASFFFFHSGWPRSAESMLAVWPMHRIAATSNRESITCVRNVWVHADDVHAGFRALAVSFSGLNQPAWIRHLQCENRTSHLRASLVEALFILLSSWNSPQRTDRPLRSCVPFHTVELPHNGERLQSLSPGECKRMKEEWKSPQRFVYSCSVASLAIR